MKRVSTTALVLLGIALLCGLQAQTAWVQYNSPEGRYGVLFPGQPRLSTSQGTAPTGEKFPQYFATSVDSTGAICIVEYSDNAPGTAFSFIRARNGLVAGLRGTLISDEVVHQGGYTGHAFKISTPGPDAKGYIVRARNFQAGSRVYLLEMIVSKSSNALVASATSLKFFGSFQIAKPK